MNLICKHCQNDDEAMLEVLGENEKKILIICDVCSKQTLFIKEKKNESNSNRKSERNIRGSHEGV